MSSMIYEQMTLVSWFYLVQKSQNKSMWIKNECMWNIVLTAIIQMTSDSYEPSLSESDFSEFQNNGVKTRACQSETSACETFYWLAIIQWVLEWFDSQTSDSYKPILF